MPFDKGIRVAEENISGQVWYAFLISPQYRWTRHLILLIMFVLLVLNPGDGQREYPIHIDWMVKIALTTYLIIQIYINIYWLVPRFLLQGRFYVYLLTMLGLGVLTFVIIVVVDDVLDAYRYVAQRERPENLLSTLLEFLIAYNILLASSTAYKLFQHWIRNLEYFNRIQKVNYQQELSLLKSQINPHFLFNTLNNAHILIQSEPTKASSMILNLSDLLRYQLYECSSDKVFLASDIAFIADFLQLESTRRDDFTFNIVRMSTFSDVMVAPMLFIPFVENAVKHNTDNMKPTFVWVSFEVKNAVLTFVCLNSKKLDGIEMKPKKDSGIGLANISRRLDLLYPNKYDLQIEDRGQTFYVKLELYL
ncbi:sensor histidine kinase [Sphingobacterium sp. Mn56C]|uniref:sensor histidine kinase n=1 Tax=Sphingobacterium sp. Mn56C TaxID=3395261 RepID=UPI003BBF954D